MRVCVCVTLAARRLKAAGKSPLANWDTCGDEGAMGEHISNRWLEASHLFGESL